MGRREIERLYRELREAFERASQAEALRRSERLKSALLDAVTHDIRTPLTSIKASVTTLLDAERRRADGGHSIKLDADSRRDMLEVIDEESDRLDRFVEGLIELARIEAGDFRVDLGARAVVVCGSDVRLTPKEFELLVYFLRHPGKVLTHRALLAAVWGGESVEQTEYLRVFIGQLRKKVEADPARPRYILTEPWIGYRFDPGA